MLHFRTVLVASLLASTTTTGFQLSKVPSLKNSIRSHGKGIIATFVVGELVFSATAFGAAVGAAGLMNIAKPVRAATGLMVVVFNFVPPPLRVAAYLALHRNFFASTQTEETPSSS